MLEELSIRRRRLNGTSENDNQSTRGEFSRLDNVIVNTAESAGVELVITDKDVLSDHEFLDVTVEMQEEEETDLAPARTSLIWKTVRRKTGLSRLHSS